MALPKKRQSKARGVNVEPIINRVPLLPQTVLSAVKPNCPTEHVPIAGIIVDALLYLHLR